MNKRSIWQEEYIIRTYEVGRNGRLSITSLCNFMQECASNHAQHLGFGKEYLDKTNRLWALTRLHIHIDTLPETGGVAIVQTWPRGTTGVFAFRDFLVADSEGRSIAAVTSSWLLLDVESKKPARPDHLLSGMPIESDRHAVESPLQKLPTFESGEVLDQHIVRVSDIDGQDHTNNARYVEWLENAFYRVAAEGDIPASCEINFLAEAKLGDAVVISYASAGEDELLFAVKRSPDGAELLRAKIATKEASQRVSTAKKDQDDAYIGEAALFAAERILALELTPPERQQITQSIQDIPMSYRKRRTVALSNELSPAPVFRPAAGNGLKRSETPSNTQHRKNEGIPDLPESETDIAFAPISALSHWLRRGDLSSIRLTEIYLKRLKAHGSELECVVTITENLAFEQAERADRELKSGNWRGPLHGIPWGAKDLLDTAGVLTTWGATPYKDRVPTVDASVVRLLKNSGAVLLGKLTLGALALGDVWFDGKTRNPWNLDQGSSGSSAGSAAATAAGLSGFCIGSETLGSIVSPSLVCGTTGLKPTFGRVPRAGAMALSWSFDKIGPICRCVKDAALVLSAISAHDSLDSGSQSLPFKFDDSRPAAGTRVGYQPDWFSEDEKGESFEGTLKAAKDACAMADIELVELSLPELPYQVLFHLISVDVAAAFEELTLSGRDDDLVRQDKDAWPNILRTARFIPAVEYVQLQRFRRLVMESMQKTFLGVDALISPENRSNMLVISNATGEPSLTIRAGFREDGTPFGLTIWGDVGGEASICRIGMVFEEKFDVWDKRPERFAES